jgi:hypothetical protein
LGHSEFWFLFTPSHSGEDHKLEICKFDKAPSNNKERLVILQTMHAHSQFCLSGDNTLPATKHAIDSLAEEEADEHFVIVLSDANFDRYGIPINYHPNMSNRYKIKINKNVLIIDYTVINWRITLLK